MIIFISFLFRDFESLPNWFTKKNFKKWLIDYVIRPYYKWKKIVAYNRFKQGDQICEVMDEFGVDINGTSPYLRPKGLLLF